MPKAFLWIAVPLLLVGCGAWWLQAGQSSRPISTGARASPLMQASITPTVTWSVSKLTATIFPGTSSTTNVNFRSSTPLDNVQVGLTPSLNGIATVSPTSLPSIGANQDYSLTLTLTAPPEFIKREFGGTIQIRSGRATSNVYPTTLEVVLRTDWKTSTSTGGSSISFPIATTEEVIGNDLRIESPTVGNHDKEGLSSTEFFIDVFSLPLANDPSYLSHIATPESVVLANGTPGVRGYRADDLISPLPGYDMYVPVGNRLYVVAGTYDGVSSTTLSTIKSIQQSFLP